MQVLEAVSFIYSMAELNNNFSTNTNYSFKVFFMKFSKVLKVLVAAMFSGLVVNAQSGRTLSLREAVETGTKNNLQVNQANLNMQRAGVNWQQAKGNMIPSLGASVGHTFSSGRGLDRVSNAYVNQEQYNADWGLGSDVTIFNG